MLQRLAGAFPEQGLYFDLDSEIENKEGGAVSEIFEIKGEAAFRNLEAEVFQKLYPFAQMIAVGAGFDLKLIPESAKVVWIRRSTDLQGRIFTDRPRLLQDTDPLSEFEIKRKEREPVFSFRAQFIYTAPEGIALSDKAKELERKFFKSCFAETSEIIGGIKTVFPADLSKGFFAQPDYFELRDDLLSKNQIKQFASLYGPERCLYSFRASSAYHLESYALIDQPIEMKNHLQISETKKMIFSSHHDDIYEGMRALAEKPQSHLKLSPLIFHWKDLLAGHQWQQKDQKNRSFLPRSPEGRWKWYRLYQKGRQLLNFWYEGQSSAPDQPSFLEWALQPKESESFAAVLGSPVFHSLSPMMHLDFFQIRNHSFFAIDIKEEEWNEALSVLQFIGLKAAAVTAPLKKIAFKYCSHHEPLALELSSVNTMLFESELKKWLGANTDFLGFVKSLEGKELPPPFVIWGGGGVLSMIKKALPDASAYSARLAKPKTENCEFHSPLTVIWAASPLTQIQFPPDSWQPKTIIDLNYAENSLGRQYALETKSCYQSGFKFFYYQAMEQQKFWNNFINFALKINKS